MSKPNEKFLNSLELCMCNAFYQAFESEGSIDLSPFQDTEIDFQKLTETVQGFMNDDKFYGPCDFVEFMRCMKAECNDLFYDIMNCIASTESVDITHSLIDLIRDNMSETSNIEIKDFEERAVSSQKAVSNKHKLRKIRKIRADHDKMKREKKEAIRSLREKTELLHEAMADRAKAFRSIETDVKKRVSGELREEYGKIIICYEKKLESYKKEIADRKKSFKETNQRLQELEHKLDHVDVRLIEKENKITDTENRVTEVEQKLSDCEQKLSVSRFETDNIKDLLNKKNFENSTIQHELKSKELEILELEQAMIENKNKTNNLSRLFLFRAMIGGL